MEAKGAWEPGQSDPEDRSRVPREKHPYTQAENYIPEVHAGKSMTAETQGTPGSSGNTRRNLMLGAGMLVVAAAIAVGVGVALSNGSGSDSRDQPSTLVEAAMKLPLSKSDFKEAEQKKFRAGVAKAAGTTIEDVSIKSIAEVTSRKALTIQGRRAAPSIVVDFSIAVASAEVASTLAQSLSEDKLNTALEEEGLPRGVMVAAPKVKDTSAPPPAPPPAPSPTTTSPPAAPSTARRAASVAFGGTAELAPDETLKYIAYAETANPNFPGDYCDFCNCSIPRKSGCGGDPDCARIAFGEPEMAASQDAGADANAGAEDFSGTNNQVEDVDEADYVKTDGQYIYMLPKSSEEKKIVIAKAFPAAEAEVVSTTDLSTYGFAPRVLLLEGDVLVVIGNGGGMLSDNSAYMTTMVQQMWDVSNRNAPQLQSSVELEGSYLAARMIQGRAYVVVQTFPAWIIPYRDRADEKTLRSASPLFRTLTPAVARDKKQRGDVPFQAVKSRCDQLGRLTGLGDLSTWITVLATDADKARSTYGTWNSVTHAGRGGTVYVSTQRIYVASTTYDYARPKPSAPIPNEDAPKPRSGVWSAILTFDLNSGAPTFGGLAEVDGSIINQFALDEFNGYLRVATTKGEMWATPTTSESLITVLDQDLGRVGLLSGLAPGERIYSVRFMGQRGYVVTFRQVDPFFVFDLSQPASPQLLGYLKIPGFSDYLHPLDATHMLGVGKDTVEVGERVSTKGVKLSLFNVADPENPQEEAVLVLGDRGTTTEVSYDHKAFLYHQGSGVIALPIDLHQVVRCPDTTRTQGGACPGSTDQDPTESTFQGAYVLYLEGTDQKRFSVHGRITHEHLKGVRNDAADTSRVMSGLWGGWDYWRQSLRRVYRSIYMDGHLYTLSDRHMQAHLLDTMEEKAVLNWTTPVCYPAQVYANGNSFGIAVP